MVEANNNNDSLPTGLDHWQSNIQGHGITYFREMVVEFKTLQWTHSLLAEMKKTRREVKVESFGCAVKDAYRSGSLQGYKTKTGAPSLPADFEDTVRPIAERRAVLAG